MPSNAAWQEKPTPTSICGGRRLRRHNPPNWPSVCMIIFARLGRPGANATFGAAKFDHMRIRFIARDTPVEAVAAEIAQPAALLRVGGKRIDRAERVIFGMRSGQHRAIRRDQRDASSSRSSSVTMSKSKPFASSHASRCRSAG